MMSQQRQNVWYKLFSPLSSRYNIGMVLASGPKVTTQQSSSASVRRVTEFFSAGNRETSTRAEQLRGITAL
jgi:hypothetical protein